MIGLSRSDHVQSRINGRAPQITFRVFQRIGLVPAAQQTQKDRLQRIFGIAGKGRLAVGWDADLTIVDLKARRTIRHADMATRVGWTPFDGMEARAWPMATVIRGQLVMRDGELVASGQGQPMRFLENLGGMA